MTDRELFEHINVEEMLIELGVRNVRSNPNGEVEFSCPFAGHSSMDSSPSASMTVEERDHPNGGTYPKTSWNCFGCGMKGTAISFLAEFEGISPIKAKRFLRERFAPTWSDTPDEHTLVDQINAMFRNDPSERRPTRPVPVLEETELDPMYVDWIEVFAEWDQTHNSPEPYCYMLDRGFEPETLMDFEVGFDFGRSKRFSIPVRNEHGELVGFKGRAWWEDASPRYKALGGEDYNFETLEFSRVLFALNIARNHNHLIVREGELNAMKMHEWGWTNTVGISGKNLSETQIYLIKKYADSVTFYFDEMEDSMRAAEKVEMALATTVMWTENDPVDSSRSEVEHAYEVKTNSLILGIRQLC